MRKISTALCTLSLLTLVVLTQAAQAQIPSTFFGMGAAVPNDMPKVPYGVLSHPAVAWTEIEGTGRGVYNFRSMDAFVRSAPKNANGVALIDIPFGWTPGWAIADQSSCIKNNKTGAVSCTEPPDNIQDWIDFITTVTVSYTHLTLPTNREV